MATVLNQDVAGIYRRTERVISEINKSQSSPVTGFIQADLDRLQQYIDLLNAYKGWVVNQPQLDLPETHPREFVLETEEEKPELENESLMDMRRIFESLVTEMINSQSARLPSGLIKYDADRFDLLMAKAQTFLTDFILVQQPVDFPESSPQEASTGPGRTGI